MVITLVGAEFQILLVEDSFRQPAEKAGHPVL